MSNWKTVSGGGVNKSAWKVLVPEKFDWPNMLGELRKEWDAIGKDIVKDFEKTTTTWTRNKPRFVVDKDENMFLRFEGGSQKWEMTIGPHAQAAGDTKGGTSAYQIWVWLDDGTRPHVIVPKKAPRLAFIWDGFGSYRPKTKPGVIDSFEGGSTGDWVYRKRVKHPGHKPRRFTQTITRKWQLPIYKRMEAAMNRAARLSKHAYTW